MIRGERKTNHHHDVYGATGKAGNKERNFTSFTAEEVNKEEKKKKRKHKQRAGDTNFLVTPS